jgi:hypothetical protein
MGAGLALGIGGSVWIQRKAKAMVARYHPSTMADAATGRVRSWPGELREALREGRQAMRDREAELRAASYSDGNDRPGRP